MINWVRHGSSMTFETGLRVWNLLDNCWSLPCLQQTRLSDNKISAIVFCVVWAIFMLASNVSSQIPTCHCKIMWLVGSKPIRSNVTMPTTSFLCVLCHSKLVMIRVKEYFCTHDVMCYALWHHLSSLPNQFLIFEDVGAFNLTTLPLYYREYITPPHQGAIAQNNYVVQWYIIFST